MTEITIESLIAAGHDEKTAKRIFMYSKKVAANIKKREEFYATPEGKEYFKEKARRYYREHSEEIKQKYREKRKAQKEAANETPAK